MNLLLLLLPLLPLTLITTTITTINTTTSYYYHYHHYYYFQFLFKRPIFLEITPVKLGPHRPPKELIGTAGVRFFTGWMPFPSPSQQCQLYGHQSNYKGWSWLYHASLCLRNCMVKGWGQHGWMQVNFRVTTLQTKPNFLTDLTRSSINYATWPPSSIGNNNHKSAKHKFPNYPWCLSFSLAVPWPFLISKFSRWLVTL